jgi:regulator of sigma E protease
MAILLFVVVLVALIVVHELGHFFAAKAFRMRVDEFGIGYPPRAIGWRKGETEYTLNWLPFGGFVKIFGEDASEGVPAPRSFAAKPKWQQALVLVAGIAMNLFFAYLLLTLTLAVGMPRSLSEEEAVRDPEAALVVSSVMSGSPAEEAGLKPGDLIRSATYEGVTFSGPRSSEFTTFVANAPWDIELTVERAGETLTFSALPESGIIPDDLSRAALGVAISPVGTIPVPLHRAPLEGAVLTWEVTKQTALGLTHFFAGIATFSADLSQVSGPVGIAGAVGDAGASGIVPLLTLTAIISINLALINLLPFPALDGGRLLFVAIEAVTRRPIPPQLANALNFGGFALLILLMLVITASDVFKIFT